MILIQDLSITFLRVSGWSLLSWVLGISIGYACYKSKLIEVLSMPIVNVIRHISPFCWLPLIILFAGIGEMAVGITLLISLAFHGVIVTLQILNNLPRQVVEQARLDGTSGWNMFWYIELPICKAEAIDLFRVLWGVGWSSIIAAEMLGVQSGMGYRLLDFRYLLRYQDMLVYISVIGAVGMLCDALLKSIKQKARSWT